MIKSLSLLQRAGYQPLAIKAGTKRPLHRGWQERRISLDEIVNRSSDSFGLRTGDNGLTVLDIDAKHHAHPKQFVRSFYEHLECLGFDFDFTVSQATPTDGGHLFYRSAAPQPNTKLSYARDGRVLFETRGIKGQALIYDLEEVVKVADLQVMPSGMEKILLGAARDFGIQKESKKGVFTEFNETHSTVDILVEHGWTVVKEDDVKFVVLRPGEVSSDSSAHVFKDSDKLYCWSNSTVFEAQKPYSTAEVEIQLRHAGDKRAFIEANQSSTGVMQYSDPSLDQPDMRKYFKKHSISELIELSKQPLPKKLMGEFWSEGEVGILFASANVGKSALALRVALSLARGESFDEEHILNELDAGKVLYFDFELSPRQLALRLSESMKGTENLLVFTPGDDSCDSVLLAIETELEVHNPIALVIDNLSAINPDNEAASEAAGLVKSLKALARKFETSLLVIAHTPKIDSSVRLELKHLAGSAQLGNLVDVVMAMGRSSRDKDERYLKQLKVRSFEHRYGEDSVLGLKLVRNEEGLTFEVLGTEEEDAMLAEYRARTEGKHQMIWDLHLQGKSRQEIEEVVGLGKSQVNTILRKMRAKHGDRPTE